MKRRTNTGAWVFVIVSILAIAGLIVFLFVGNGSKTSPEDPATPTTPTVDGVRVDGRTVNDPTTYTLMDTSTWIAGLNTRLSNYRQKGHTWVDDFHIESGKITLRRAALSAYDGDKNSYSSAARTWSSKTEKRFPQKYIDDAVEFAIPEEIKLDQNINEARDYIFCCILTDPTYGDMYIQHFNEEEFITASGATLTQSEIIFKNYYRFAYYAYANTSRANFTGYISDEWIKNGWAPCGWETMKDPYSDIISHQVNLATGRFDYESVAVRICQILEYNATWTNPGKLQVKSYHHLIRTQYDSQRRTTLETKDLTSKWVKFSVSLDNGKKADGLVRTGDLRIAHVNPTKPVATPTPPPVVTETPQPTATPTAPPTNPPTDPPTNPPTEKPTETPTEKPTETPTEKPTETPTEKPTETPTEKPTEEPSPTPHKEEEEKPDEQGYAPVWGGDNQDGDGAGPAEETPMVPTAEPGNPGEYQPQADPPVTVVPVTEAPPVTAPPAPADTPTPVVVVETTPEPVAETAPPNEEAGTADENTEGDFWLPN